MNRVKKDNFLLAIYCIGIVMLFFGVNYIQEFSVDTYALFAGYDWKFMLHSNGRLITILICWIFEQLPLSGHMIYFISWCNAVLFLSLAVYILAEMIYKMSNCQLLSVCISFLSIANFFSVEYFLFIEKGVFMLQLLLIVIAVYLFEKYMHYNNWKHLLSAFICLLVSVFIYQTNIGLFVIISLPFIIKNSSDLKKFFRYCSLVAVFYGVNMLIAYLVTKIILDSNRISSDIDILNSMKDTWKWIKIVTKNGLNILPDNFFLCVLLILICGGIYCIKYAKKKLFDFGGLLFIICGCYFAGFFPYLTGITASYSPRILYPFASILGVLLIYYYVKELDKHKSGYSVILICTILTLVVQYAAFTDILLERYQMNQTDKYLSEIIELQIRNYEAETNQEIKYVCFYNDMYPCYCYPDLNTASFLSVRAHGTTWSDLNSLNYYLGTSYEKGAPRADYAAYFLQNNWDTYSEEQLLFDGDTLHICAY